MPLISVPPAVNYPNQLIGVPIRWANSLPGNPPEGPQLINIGVTWGSMGGTSHCVYVNLQNNATLNFSQVATLSVDNSACAADIQFVFPDTGETTTIPAYAPKVVVPIFSNSNQFYIYAPNAQSDDVSNISILNFLPPPIDISTTQEQNFVAEGSILANSATTTALVSSSISGTLENCFISASLGVSASAGCAWQLIDGNSNVLAAGRCAIVGTASQQATVLNLQGVHVRFQNGLGFKIVSTTFGGDSSFSVNAYYRTP